MGAYFCQLWHRDAGLSFASRLRKKKARHLPCFLKSRRTACMESLAVRAYGIRHRRYGNNAKLWMQPVRSRLFPLEKSGEVAIHLREAQHHWAQAHIICRKQLHLPEGQHHLRQRRGLVHLCRFAAMMFSLRSK